MKPMFVRDRTFDWQDGYRGWMYQIGIDRVGAFFIPVPDNLDELKPQYKPIARIANSLWRILVGKSGEDKC